MRVKFNGKYACNSPILTGKPGPRDAYQRTVPGYRGKPRTENMPGRIFRVSAGDVVELTPEQVDFLGRDAEGLFEVVTDGGKK